VHHRERTVSLALLQKPFRAHGFPCRHLLTCGQDGHVHIFASSNLEQITKDGEIVKQTDVFRGNPLNCIAYSNVRAPSSRLSSL
jgi:hypothetical protein